MFPISHYPVITKHDDPQPSVMVHLNRIPRRSISGMLLFGSCPAKCHYPAECIRLGVLLPPTQELTLGQSLSAGGGEGALCTGGAEDDSE